MSTRRAIFDLEFRLPNQKGVQDAAQSVSVLQQNVDNAKKGSLEYIEASRKLETAQKKLSKDFDTSSKSVGGFSQTLSGAARSLTAFLAIGSGIQVLRGAVSTLQDFEQAVANLAAITGATGGDLEFYKEQARAIGETTSLSASQAVEGFQLIASGSPQLLENAEALAAVTSQAATLAEAAGITLPEAAAALTNSLNSLNLPAEDAGRVINVLAAGATFGAREIPFVNQALEKFGATAAAAGIEIEQSVAAIELLGKTSSDAGGVGTNLRNVITILRQEAAKQGREFKGLTGELEGYADKLDDVNFLVKTFGRENLNAAQQLIQSRSELEQLTEKLTDTDEAYRQAEVRTSTLTGEIARLRSVYESVVLSLSESTTGLTSVLRFLRENFTTIIRLVGSVAAGFIGYRGAILATNLALRLARVQTLAQVTAKGLLTGATNLATTAVQRLNAAVRANPFVAVAALLATATAAFFSFRKSVDDAADAQSRFNDEQQRNIDLLARGRTIQQRITVIGELDEDQVRRLQEDIEQQLDQLRDAEVDFRANVRVRTPELDAEVNELEERIQQILGSSQEAVSARGGFALGLLTEDEIRRTNTELLGLEGRLRDLKNERRALVEGATLDDVLGTKEFQSLTDQIKELETASGAVDKRLKEIAESSRKGASDVRTGTIAELENRVKELRKTLVEDLAITDAAFAPTVESYKAAVAELKEATDLLRDSADGSAEEGSIAALQSRVNELRDVVNNTSAEAENFGALIDQLIRAQEDLNELQARLKPIDREAIRQQEIKEEERHALALLGIREAGEERQLQLRLTYARQRLDALTQEKEAEALEYRKQANEIIELEEELAAELRRIRQQQEDSRRQQQLETLQGIQQTLNASLGSLNQLVQGQIAANQQLQTAQQQRVQEALEIASTGNSQLLKAEEQRLNEIQSKREQFVRNQQALAAAQLVAESSLAIARAAAEGGAAAPFTIAATLFALTAGLAQARATAQSAAAGFKKGGFTGYGSPSEEAGVVHKGEFVLDAPTTKMLGLQGKNMKQFKELFVNRKPMPRAVVASQAPTLTESHVGQIVDAINRKPVPSFNFDKDGVVTVVERAKHRVRKTNTLTR